MNLTKQTLDYRLTRRGFILCVAFLISTISNCGPVVKVTRLSQIPLQPKAKDDPISVFMSKAPRCPYEEIAIISTSEGAFAGGMETFVDAMKAKARVMGGDALLLGQLGTRTEGYVAIAPGVIGAAEGKTLTAIVIHFLNKDCTD